MKPTLSGRALVEHFGSTTDLIDLAAQHGMKLTYSQIVKWAQRDRVSAGGLALLVVLGQKAGRPLDLASLASSDAEMPLW
jgi:predicted TIM-barrel enzyme